MIFDNLTYSIEQSILSTFLYQDMLDEEFELIMNFKLDYTIFTTSTTIKAVAKAISIHQELEHPIDEIIIKKFLDSKMIVDDIEYLEIMKKTSLPYKTLVYYIDLLQKENKKNIQGDKFARI